MTTGYRSYRVSILIGCLGLIASLSALWPVYRAFLDIEIDGNEGWNAYYADAAMGRMPLYPSCDQLITNNYPPLSFYIVGALGWLIGDPVLAGRLLSLAAVAVVATGVGLAIKRFGGSPAAATVGAAFFVATMCRFFTDYVGMNDPHLLAQAIMTLGFVGFLRAMARDSGYGAPILLMVAAGFIKHNIIVMPLTAMVWLGINRPRQLVKCGLLAVSAIAAGFALCFAAFGADFFANLMSPRALLWRPAFDAVGHLQWLAVGLIAWLYVGLTLPRPGSQAELGNQGVRLCSLMIVLGLLSFFIQKTGHGVADNAQFELVFGVSLGVGLAFAHAPFLPLARRYSPDALRSIFLLAICLRLTASTRLEPVRLLTDPSFHAEIATRKAAMSATVARIQMSPGDVAYTSLACYRAGKPFVVDLFNSGQRLMAGKLPADAISKLLASGKLTIVDEDPLLRWSAE
jgi:hypothetical protein